MIRIRQRETLRAAELIRTKPLPPSTEKRSNSKKWNARSNSKSAGQESTLSPLELAAARLQVLETLIQQEVLFQKAEAEQTVPSEDDITTALNKLKTDSGKSAEVFQQEMQKAGITEESLRDSIKKQLATEKLIEKITGKIEVLKDSEIESFYNSNPEAFKSKRGAQLATIVIDPTDSGNDDKTKNDIEVQQRLKEISERLAKVDFATVAREFSEDSQTKFQGGDWRYFTEDEMKQAFGQGFCRLRNEQNGKRRKSSRSRFRFKAKF